eukprot:CAMPEP_0197034328 /NCGR_PEP_ID=MMETSP1384-20130603/12476_1 /TAXON_ID=29189 /ORGANISM="Ammonia sp." /LENGTH=349 /DNA_ID=CAMNT_0042464243 /DNA_START=46 /DNA_END=1095 /DNA_ORIENTATION=+
MNASASLLNTVGLVATEKVADTLQGQIWKVLHVETGHSLVAKITSKKLHQEKKCIVNGKQLEIHEDIVKEARILQYLHSTTNCPRSIVGYSNFLTSQHDYYLIMEHAGSSMFDFIVKAHTLSKSKQIHISNWKQVVQCIAKQIVEALDFLHRHNVCHYDVSIENMTLLKDPPICTTNIGRANEQLTFVEVEKNIQLKLIDFGLAEWFMDEAEDDQTCCFQSTKFCGKQCYQSPELRAMKAFNAKANDIWCLGVCLFIMLAGCQPWNVAEDSDLAFKLMTNGQMKAVLNQWGILGNFDEQSLDLLSRIFQPEAKRISLAEIKTHAWFNSNGMQTKPDADESASRGYAICR